jgi:hypothetical protein
MKFKKRHGKFEQGCVLSESYTTQLTLFCRYSRLVAKHCCHFACSLLETPFLTQDIFSAPPDLFMMRGVCEPRVYCTYLQFILSQYLYMCFRLASYP